MPTFADIEYEIKNVLDTIDDATDLDEAQADAYEEYLAELAQAEADKIDSFGFVIKALTDKAKNQRDLAAQITAKARSTERAIERLKYYYASSMKDHNLSKVSGEVFSISRRSCLSVAIDDLRDIPEEYVETETVITPDKRRISDILKAGGNVPGCHLEYRDSLQVR